MSSSSSARHPQMKPERLNSVRRRTGAWRLTACLAACAALVGGGGLDVPGRQAGVRAGLAGQSRRMSGGIDRGAAVSASGGISCRLTTRLVLGMDVFDSPLSVRRGLAPAQNDGLFNIRTLVTCRMR